MLTRLIILLAIMAAGFGSARASEPETARPVTAAYTLEVGSARLTDTYLTPLRYTGWHTALAYERYQAMKFSPERFTMSLSGSLGLDRTENPARNATMWGLLLRLDWSMMRRWRPIDCLTLAAGGGIGVEAGVLYNSRNGNNPASAKGAATLNLTGFAAWRTRLLGVPLTVTYRPTLPLTGAFFTPEYGELYYEIYLGDRQGLAHAAWPGNYFDLSQRLTVDFHLGSTAIRAGYSGRIFSSKANDIVTNIFTHAFIIGVSGDWLSVDPRKPRPADTRLIPATY